MVRQSLPAAVALLLAAASASAAPRLIPASGGSASQDPQVLANAENTAVDLAANRRNLGFEEIARPHTGIPDMAKPVWNVCLQGMPSDRIAGCMIAVIRVAESPRESVDLLSHGMAAVNAGDNERAIAYLSELLRLDPSHAQAYAHRGRAYYHKSDHVRAIADYNEALRLDPNDAATFLNRGMAYSDTGKFDEAIADYTAAIRLDPMNYRAYTLRGNAYQWKGDFEHPIADYDEALRLDPNAGDALTARGLVYQRKGDFERARADFIAALAAPERYHGGIPTHQIARKELAALPQMPTGPTFAERRVALVIGNGDYASAPLVNPVNDARAVAQTLRDIGFVVSEGTNLDRTGMERLVRDFLDNVADARVALLFYAGHGMQVAGKNYLVPVDAKLPTVNSLDFETIEVDRILDSLGDINRTNIVILDACRNNPLARSFAARLGATRSSAVSPGLAGYSAVGTGMLIAFSTAPGQEALDGTEANSPFTIALIKHLRTPGIEIQQMLTRVRIDVARMTNNKQVPWANSSLLGEVYLAGQ